MGRTSEKITRLEAELATAIKDAVTAERYALRQAKNTKDAKALRVRVLERRIAAVKQCHIAEVRDRLHRKACKTSRRVRDVQ